MELSKYIDHTLLKADATKEQILKLCKEAIEYNFKTVCVNPSYIELCKEALKDSGVLVCTVIGFPLGQMTKEAKVFEAKDAIEKGADEVDMVLNIAKLKDGELNYVTDEIKAIKDAIGTHPLKVIIETCLLSKEEKINACHCVTKAKADFIKTSTGFSHAGATFEDVKLMHDHVAGLCEVKAAGGVRSHEDFLKMIELGATRIGTSSGVKLLNKEENNDSY